jgi:hypothetical protein
MKDKNKEQYTDAELKKMGIKLHIDRINLSLINKKKYRKIWKNIVYNIWIQFGIDYFDNKYEKMLGYPYRFSWTQEVEDEFERIFKKELKILQGIGRFIFKLEYYPRMQQ